MDTFASVMIKLGVCESKESLSFYQSGICIIKISDKFSDSIYKNNPCKDCESKNKPVFNHYSRGTLRVNPRKLMECQNWCDDIAYSIGLGCAWCATPLGKAACAASLYALKNACHWCCSDGNFYEKCLRPLQAFNPRDPAWDDDNDGKRPERDLNDRDIIWNDPDVVYNWDDI